LRGGSIETMARHQVAKCGQAKGGEKEGNDEDQYHFYECETLLVILDTSHIYLNS
jgi:hypothetical protein